MNTKLIQLAAAGVALTLLSGCSVYSSAVNSLDGDARVSDLQIPGDEYVLSDAAPPFCPAPEIYMVMPEENKGVIFAQLNNDEEYLLEGDYAALTVTEAQRTPYTSNQEEMMALFGDAIEHIPPAPTYHTVYFETDTTTLTAESQQLISDIYAEIANRPYPEVVVIGHTDTQASAAYNIGLSQARAELVKADLLSRGINPAEISIEARGESDLLVQTADNVDEPLNRRVVINVR